MKKYLSLIIISSFLIFLGGTSYAQNGPNANQQLNQEQKNQRELRKIQVENNQGLIKQKFENLKAQIKNEKNALQANILEKRILGREQALNRFDIAITRIEALKDKITTVLSKHKANGLEVAPAEKLIEEADLKIITAKEKVNQMYTLLTNSTNQLTTEQKEQLRNLTKETNTLLVETRQIFNTTIKLVKEIIQEKINELKDQKTSESENEVETETENEINN